MVIKKSGKRKMIHDDNVTKCKKRLSVTILRSLYKRGEEEMEVRQRWDKEFKQRRVLVITNSKTIKET